jgi:hypothetical protein
MGFGRVNIEMQNALNTYFKEQAELEGDCLVDYVQFDNQYEKVFENIPVGEAEAVIEPRGGTALLDAIGRGATELGEKLKAMRPAKRPGTVLVVVVTDGHENASKEWNSDMVKELVRKQEDNYNWEFVFLGANIDAVATGALYGFKGSNSMSYDTKYTGQTVAALSNFSTVTRGGGKAAFSDDDRKNAMGKS